MAFDHLLESAELCFADAETYRQSKPETSLACTSDGHEILASFYLANDDPRFKDEIHLLLRNELTRFSQFGSRVRSFPQHKYAILALSISAIDLAKEILALPIERKNWSKFDAYVTYCICKVLGVPQDATAPEIAPTKAEAGFVVAIGGLLEKRKVDYGAIEAFWKAHHRKRYQLTIFEHRNLFGAALHALEKAV
jgi:hypothetical protein